MIEARIRAVPSFEGDDLVRVPIVVIDKVMKTAAFRQVGGREILQLFLTLDSLNKAEFQKLDWDHNDFIATERKVQLDGEAGRSRSIK